MSLFKGRSFNVRFNITIPRLFRPQKHTNTPVYFQCVLTDLKNMQLNLSMHILFNHSFYVIAYGGPDTVHLQIYLHNLTRLCITVGVHIHMLTSKARYNFSLEKTLSISSIGKSHDYKIFLYNSSNSFRIFHIETNNVLVMK